MVFAFCFCQTMAVLSYRINKHSLGLSHLARKVIHGLWHCVAVGAMVAALVYIVRFHNNIGWYHLSSAHSWLGVVLLLLYSNNYVLGFLSFALPKENSPSRLRWVATYLPSHRFVGMTTFFMAAVVMQTGIAQKAWIDGGGCIPPITSLANQNNPALGYETIPAGCRVGDAVSMLIIANAVTGTYALWDFTYFGSPNYRGPPAAEDGKAGDAVKARPAAPIGGEGDGAVEVGIPGGAVRGGETVEAGGGR